jgi:hypothetical protein
VYYVEVKWKGIHFPTVLCIFFKISLLSSCSSGSVGCFESWVWEKFAKIIYN